MDIKEIALRVGAQGLPIEGTAYKFCMLDFCSKEVLIEFAEALIAEALIAELAKGNEPVMVLFQHKDTGRTTSIEPQSASDFGRINKRWINCGPLFSFPPTAEQIANETAEAIALMFDSRDDGDGFYDPNEPAEIVRSGAWKDFKK